MTGWPGGAVAILFALLSAAAVDPPAALVFVNGDALVLKRPGQAETVIRGERWISPTSPVIVDAAADTVVFSAHRRVRLPDRSEGVQIEMSEIYLLTPAGVRPLTGLGVIATAPDVTADGRNIVFVSNDHARLRSLMPGTNSMELYLLRPPWRLAKRLTTDGGAKFNPRWSPDGGRIAYVRIKDEAVGLYVLDLVTRRTVLIAEGGNYPTWSPDGRTLAFTLNGRIMAADPDTGPLPPLVPLLPASYRGYASFARWTGSGLLFQCMRDNEEGISLLDPATGKVRVLVSGREQLGGSDLAD